MLKSLCSGWEFTEKWTEDFPAFHGAAQEVAGRDMGQICVLRRETTRDGALPRSRGP